MRNGSSWPAVVGRVAGVLLGLVLLVAAWAKVIDPLAFAEQIAAEGLDLVLAAGPMAIFAIGLEIGLGLALVLGERRWWILWPTGLLIVLFLSLTGRAYWLWSHGLLDEASCGCFGNLVQRTPAEAFWQDLLMLVPLYALTWLGRPRHEESRFPIVRAVVVAIAMVAGVLLAWRAPSLPLDNLATRLKPGVTVDSMCVIGDSEASSICLDVLIPALADGEHWVVITELDNETFLADIESLNELAVDPTSPSVTVLSADPAEAHQTFFWQQGPAFDVREVPLALVRPLYRTTPRSFRLENGKVSQTFAGLPPGVGSAIAKSDD